MTWKNTLKNLIQTEKIKALELENENAQESILIIEEHLKQKHYDEMIQLNHTHQQIINNLMESITEDKDNYKLKYIKLSEAHSELNDKYAALYVKYNKATVKKKGKSKNL